MIQNLINHVALVVDRSGSMEPLRRKVVEVFDSEISHLKRRSVELHQETRISVYLFGSTVECLVFDMDVMRMESLEKFYLITGQTALIDGTLKALGDMAKLPELYGDHAFLTYVLTDGEENHSRTKPDALQRHIANLPTHWTVACMVPSARAIHEVKKFGFPAESIQTWDVSERGVEKAGREFRGAMESYMTLRSQGVRGTKSFFKTDLGNVSQAEVKATLTELKPSTYQLLPVRKDSVIQPFVESWIKSGYVKGSAYYELMKPEDVQGYKEICVQNRANGKIYAGSQARALLGLPTHELRVTPGDHGDWRIFVQSTSVNRKLVAGTFLLVRL